MRYAVRFAVVWIAMLVPMPWGGAAGQVRQDSVRAGRAMSAAEYQALRREWLESRRMGLVESPVTRYGSAMVGVPAPGVAGVPGGVGGPGDGLGYGGGFRVACQGYMVPRGGGPGWDGPRRPDIGLSYPDPSSWEFRGDCVPVGYGGPWSGPWSSWGTGPSWPSPYGGYGGARPYVEGRGGWPFGGVQEWGWSGWGWMPVSPWGWSAGAGTAYGFSPWLGASGAECARVRIVLATGQVREAVVALQALGLSGLADLDLAIDARLSRGLSVDLPGVDGRWLRIDAGTPVDDIQVLRCGG